MIYRQVRIGQLSSMLDALAQLERKWTNAGIRAARKQICEAQLRPATRGSKELDVASNTVLVFFEEIGLLFSLKILSRKFLWERLSFNIIPYWQMLEPKVIELRAKDNGDSFYDKFELLAYEMKKIESKVTGRSAIRSEAQINSYIAEELSHLNHVMAKQRTARTRKDDLGPNSTE
jgi:hypothetical protein